MKTNKYILYAMLLPVLMLAGSCSREFIPGTSDDLSLLISPVLQDGQDFVLKTRALEADDLKDDKYQENVINRLDVFFFDADGLAKDYHLSSDKLVEETHAGLTGFPLSKDFTQDGLKKNVPYTVYVIANAVSEAITTGEGIDSPSDLEALTLEDANIYKRQKNDTDNNTYTSTKSFLMNAKISWTIPSVATQLVGGAKINLTRTAVKFVIDISLSDEFKARLEAKGLQYGDPSWKYQHFNIQAYEVPGAQTAAVKSLVDSPSGGGAYLAAEALEGGTYQIVTYAYPQAWTESTSIDEAPAILLSFAASGAFHYYYIPLCQSTVGQDENVYGQTQSNNLYRVSAIINSFGSSEAVTSNDVDLTYEVMGWDEGTDKIATINATHTDYLMVVPTIYTFKGGETGVASAYQIKFYASDAVTMSNPTGYYIDKNGIQQSVTLGNNVFTYTKTGTNSGTIDLNSWVPTNGTYREIHFTLTSGGKSQEVKIRHYPLDFITAESGAYSTYNFTGWVTPGNAGTYNGASVESYYGTNYYRFNNDADGNFEARTWYNGQVYLLNINGQRTNSSIDGATNNQMYVLQITSSNDKYIVGRPNLQSQSVNVYNESGSSIGTATYSTSSDNVLSPAFMLASKLGVVSPFSSHTFAAVHCSLYKEVSNGKEYTNWRLPTKQEIEYMIENQRVYTQVMSEVVGGRYYWALDGTAALNPSGSQGSEDNAYVRCVRDLTAEELAEINKFE